MEQITFQQLTDEMVRLYTEGKFAEALSVVEQHTDRFPEQTGHTTYWKMCLLSLCGRTDDLFSVFQQGLDSGLWWAASHLAIETDFDAVRELPEFKHLVAESDRKTVEAQAHIQSDRNVLVPDDTSGALPLLIGLHGRNGNKDTDIQHWEIARKRGWLVLLVQSRQALFPGSYCWDDAEKGLADILFHLEELKKDYNIDPHRIVIAGFSQGSGQSIYTALTGKVGARGFIGVATFIAEPDVLVPLIDPSKPVRGYFVTGEKDHTLDKARAIQKILKENDVPFAEEVHPELQHQFSQDFEKTFDKAIDFIFKEQE
jgi:dienelactone hydrolase